MDDKLVSLNDGDNGSLDTVKCPKCSNGCEFCNNIGSMTKKKLMNKLKNDKK